MGGQDNKASFEKFRKDFDRLWDEYTRANPSYFSASAFQLCRDAIKNLKKYVEDPREKEIDWGSPAVMLMWRVELDEELNPQFFTVTPEDLKDEKSTIESLVYHLMRGKSLVVFRAVTRDLVVIKEDDQCCAVFPPEIEDELSELSDAEEENEISQLLNPEPFPFRFSVSERSESQDAAKIIGLVEVQVLPLAIDVVQREAYFPVVVCLTIEGGKRLWRGKKWRGVFWDTLIESLGDRIHGDSFDFLRDLVPEFCKAPVTITECVRRQYADKFERGIRPFIAYQARHVDETGEFATVIGRSGMPSWVMPDSLSVEKHGDLKDLLKIDQETNIFRKHGEFWAVMYQGLLVFLKDSKGPKYIAHLLGSPRKIFNILELVSAVEGHAAHDVAKTYAGMTDEQLEEYGLSKREDLGDAGDVLDEKAIEQYESELKKLNREIDRAVKVGDEESIAKLQQEKALYEQMLHDGRGLGAGVRKTAETAEKARKAVSRVVNAALRRIRKDHPTLGRHLSRSLKIGKICCYEPEEEIRWIV